jgi:hypothetical protein
MVGHVGQVFDRTCADPQSDPHDSSCLITSVSFHFCHTGRRPYAASNSGTLDHDPHQSCRLKDMRP